MKLIKVKSIKKIGKADVYNMEVEKNHNFSIEGGLIVHNCMDAKRYAIYTHFKEQPDEGDILILGRK